MVVDIGSELELLKQQGRLRTLKDIPVGRQSALLNLSSNDYLGLTADYDFRDQFYAYYRKNDTAGLNLGVASSRLLTGSNKYTIRLEKEIARIYGRQAALVYNSGYHANIGVLPTISGKKDLILSDKLNHISIQDGLALSKAQVKRFKHSDYEHLEYILNKEQDRHDNIYVVTESVFSMDGDCADLVKLVELKEKYNAMLYVDEAHALGLYGSKGLGKIEEQGVVEKIDFVVGTFGKAFASVGAFVVCPKDYRDYLINRSRSFVYTTALPPVVINWNCYVLERLASFHARRENLISISRRLRSALTQHGLHSGGETNIIPVIIGDIQKTVTIAESLQQQGLLVLPVRPPTVPEGQTRFRLSLTADMQWHQISDIPEKIARHL